MGRIFTYAVSLLVAMTTAACADPISAAIVGLAGLGGLGAVTTVATAVVDIGLAVGISYRSSVLRGHS
ncbi:hypothetical protein [Hyphomicrobium sp. DY-1]|uniref:hypothetical protein n=1 Tax=Hyphomicrobium sp. DY-1 TaxID=3075650 RepID=UPI0039C462B2